MTGSRALIAAKSSADRTQPGETRQLPRGLPPAVVELFKRRQVVPGQSLQILAGRTQRGKNLRAQLGAS